MLLIVKELQLELALLIEPELELVLELGKDLVQCPHHCSSSIYNLTPKGIQFSASTTSIELEITLALVVSLALVLELGKDYLVQCLHH